MAGMDEGLAKSHWVPVALYLRGLARSCDPPRARWPAVEATLRRAPAIAPSEACRQAGLWLEAGILETPSLEERTRELCNSGQALTTIDGNYPERWRRFSFSPPALWRAGASLPEVACATIVGSRDPSADATLFARAAAVEAAERGMLVVSGAARGIDREAAHAAESAGGALLELLPYGIERARARSNGTTLSAAAPSEGFSRLSAMERNTLLYAASDRTLVVGPRLREGGTWWGAVGALRLRLCQVFVFDDGSPGARALANLGARLVNEPAEFLDTREFGDALFCIA